MAVRFVCFLLSIGWLVPLGFSLSIMQEWMERVDAVMAGRPVLLNSFPLVSFAGQMANIAFIWLSVVAVSWSGVLLFHRQKK